MNDIIDVISSLSGFIGAFGGILISTKLNNYRIEQLEKKVEKHNSVVERTYVIEEQIKVANHRIDDLEREVHHH
ncbi:MAG: hypothetical protein SPK18_04695 [Treponema sp.]|nr:hypothetical protein [Oscillospiraceae bacterium]MDD6082234.1 hypothetical protein [Oscillospiraceae bacterium]MDD7534173.1 hypothetical protein [Treponema sp.]MDO5149240.1 hypothetical protein [Oscillospiraceae bacterium]MDY5757860.1 hypothetical protein [Treponema sp.]